jgi:ubiquitin-activating enzyme E1
MNFHIDFVTAACNLRASNYRIKQASRHKCKMIAGKIIPAIATATAAVTGLACLELLKVLQRKPLEAFKDSSNNLGLNMYFLQEPAPAVKTQERYDDIEMAHMKPYPTDFTKWDSIVVDEGPLSLEGFLAAFRRQTGLNVTLLYHKASGMDGPQKGRFLYNSEEYLPAKRELYAARLTTDLAAWVLERYEGAPVELVGPHRKYLELETSAADDDGNPFLTPTVIYRWAR